MPKINPDILIWGRQTAGLSLDEAANKLGLRDTKAVFAQDQLLLLETGEKEPSRAILLKMAKHYRRPLLAFYMTSPPQKGVRGSDFRTLPEASSQAENAVLDTMIRQIRARQNMVRALMEDEDDAERVNFIGSVNIDYGTDAVCDSIRTTLNFQLSEFRKIRTVENAFSYLRQNVEACGVFVILMGNLGSHHTTLSVEVFRGFALSDALAPFVIINDQDAKSAWSFTLLHELVHLWLGETGVSGSINDVATERFCNDVASELLLPSNELPSLMENWSENLTLNKAHIDDFARARNLSSSMVVYKLYRKNFIDKATWKAISKDYRDRWFLQRAQDRAASRNQDSGPSYYMVRRHRLGTALLQFVNRTMAEGVLTTSKAGAILGVKPQNIQSLMGTVSQ